MPMSEKNQHFHKIKENINKEHNTRYHCFVGVGRFCYVEKKKIYFKNKW